MTPRVKFWVQFRLAYAKYYGCSGPRDPGRTVEKDVLENCVWFAEAMSLWKVDENYKDLDGFSLAGYRSMIRRRNHRERAN